MRVRPIPEGYHSVTPYLMINGVAEAIEFYRRAFGATQLFKLDAPEGKAKERAFALLDALKVIDISNNLGDSKTLITHPATTTHRAMGPGGRAAIGLTDGVIRLSVGLEDVSDLQTDLGKALTS